MTSFYQNENIESKLSLSTLLHSATRTLVDKTTLLSFRNTVKQGAQNISLKTIQVYTMQLNNVKFLYKNELQFRMLEVYLYKSVQQCGNEVIAFVGEHVLSESIDWSSNTIRLKPFSLTVR